MLGRVVSGGLIGLGLLAGTAHAADKPILMPVQGAMNKHAAQLGMVAYYFGKAPTPKVLEQLGTLITSRKANLLEKTDEEACHLAFFAVMRQFREQARKLGANAVVRIVSFYDGRETTDDRMFECRRGSIMVGVVLRADFARLER
jgi:uncharacterized protein YbjQ (UPF0145 family)